MRKSRSRAVLRGVAFLLLTAGLLPLAVAGAAFGPAVMRPVRRLWCRGTARLLGLRLSLEGEPFDALPTLFVANHVSYLDIAALGAFLDATFIAKREVAGWPLLGFLARLAGTFFVRRRWREARIQRDALAARMRRGESFILFGEGTSTNGLAVRRFKTSLLGVAEPWLLDRPVAVQGVTLAYVRLADGTPIGPETCDLYAWHGDATLMPHLWNVLQMAGVAVRIVLHEPVPSWSVACRKALGRSLEEQIALALGRGTVPAEPTASVPVERMPAAARTA
ncbi:lysophospholipid acyltransferase family protein [Benzoatithermus flavus]|uniref:Lysophospholipid acyltransferase family protein n=1 Tax=Benzoatithermus flavus TaxID=3108223 RepID=A0ABU8Y1M9_9PROT